MMTSSDVSKNLAYVNIMCQQYHPAPSSSHYVFNLNFFFATNFIGGNFRHLSCVSGQCPLTLKREELRLKEKRSDTTEQCPLILKQEELKKCIQQGKAEVR